MIKGNRKKNFYLIKIEIFYRQFVEKSFKAFQELYKAIRSNEIYLIDKNYKCCNNKKKTNWFSKDSYIE